MTFKEPTNDYQALVLALSLAIIAPTKEKSQFAKEYAVKLAEGMGVTPEYLERAMNEALALLESELT